MTQVDLQGTNTHLSPSSRKTFIERKGMLQGRSRDVAHNLGGEHGRAAKSQLMPDIVPVQPKSTQRSLLYLNSATWASYPTRLTFDKHSLLSRRCESSYCVIKQIRAE